MAKKVRAKSMPKWKSAPAELIQRFDQAADNLPAVDRRKMFGYPAVFLNGNMFAGLFQDQVILRLRAEDRATLAGVPGAKPFEPMPGRPMREYMVAPASIVDSTVQFRAWLERARTFAASLPSKHLGTSKRSVSARPKSKRR